MANRGSRFSFGANGSSMRESLGMPLRREFTGGGGGGGGKPMDNPATGRQGGKTKSKEAPRRQTYVTRPTSSSTSTFQKPTASSRITSGRPSAGRSSMYGAANSTVKKDPRPLSDKAYQTDMTKKLIRFLTDSGYVKIMTTTSLSPPSTREFIDIFNFLLELIDDTLPIDAMNMVDEVPSILKKLGYPFNISRNHLLNVGSPHSWPILLGAISWLREYCLVTDSTKKLLFGQGGDGFGDGLGENDQENALAVEYEIEEELYHAYMLYGEVSEQYQMIVEGKRSVVDQRCEQLHSSIEQLQALKKELSSKVDELSRSSLSALQEEAERLENDNNQLANHLDNEVIPAIREVEALNVQASSRTSELELQIETSKEKMRELEQQVRSQEMSAASARELHKSVKDSEDDLDRKRKKYHDTTTRISELQIQHNKRLQQIDAMVQLINSKLVHLAGLQPDVASLSPLDYDTSKRSDPEVPQKLVEHARLLRDEIQTLHRRTAHSINELERQILSAESASSALHTEVVRKDLEVDNIQHTLSNAREALERKRKHDEEAMKIQLSDQLALENSIRSMQLKLQTEPVQEKQYMAIKKSNDLEMEQMLKDLRQDNTAMEELVVALTKIIELMEEQNISVHANLKDLLDKYKNVKLPTLPPELLHTLKITPSTK